MVVMQEDLTLSQAIQSGNLKTVRRLINQGADVNQIEEFSCFTPLHYAVKISNPEFTQLLLDSGATASINEKTQQGNTPLHMAVKYGTRDTLRLLLEHASQKSVSEKSCLGRTLLHLVLEFSSKHILELLLLDARVRALIDVEDNDGNTPLVVALRKYWNPPLFSKENDLDWLRMLLGAGADANRKYDRQTGESLLRTAVLKNDASVVTLLLNGGADPNDPGSHDSLLLNALRCDKTKVAEQLVLAGADINVEFNMCSAFQHVLDLENVALIRAFIEAGANVNGRGYKHDQTALHMAVKKNDVEMIEFLRSKGASFNERDSSGYTPAQLAVLCNTNDSHLDAIKVLFKKVNTVEQSEQSGNGSDLEVKIEEDGENVENGMDNSEDEEQANMVEEIIANDENVENGMSDSEDEEQMVENGYLEEQQNTVEEIIENYENEMKNSEDEEQVVENKNLKEQKSTDEEIIENDENVETGMNNSKNVEQLCEEMVEKENLEERRNTIEETEVNIENEIGVQSQENENYVELKSRVEEITKNIDMNSLPSYSDVADDEFTQSINSKMRRLEFEANQVRGIEDKKFKELKKVISELTETINGKISLLEEKMKDEKNQEIIALIENSVESKKTIGDMKNSIARLGGKIYNMSNQENKLEDEIEELKKKIDKIVLNTQSNNKYYYLVFLVILFFMYHCFICFFMK